MSLYVNVPPYICPFHMYVSSAFSLSLHVYVSPCLSPLVCVSLHVYVPFVYISFCVYVLPMFMSSLFVCPPHMYVNPPHVYIPQCLCPAVYVFFRCPSVPPYMSPSCVCLFLYVPSICILFHIFLSVYIPFVCIFPLCVCHFVYISPLIFFIWHLMR